MRIIHAFVIMLYQPPLPVGYLRTAPLGAENVNYVQVAFDDSQEWKTKKLKELQCNVATSFKRSIEAHFLFKDLPSHAYAENQINIWAHTQ